MVLASAYADDIIVAVNNDGDVEKLMKIIESFENISSSKVNWAKSSALLSGNWHGRVPKLPDGIFWERHGIKYLGVQLGDDSAEKRNWEGVVEKLNEHAKLICCHTLFKLAATMISPAMIWKLRKMRKQYDVIHVHHPDPMACLALFCSGFKGKVVLHWHSDILKQKLLLKFYQPLQNWLIRRADVIVERLRCMWLSRKHCRRCSTR